MSIFKVKVPIIGFHEVIVIGEDETEAKENAIKTTYKKIEKVENIKIVVFKELTNNGSVYVVDEKSKDSNVGLFYEIVVEEKKSLSDNEFIDFLKSKL